MRKITTAIVMLCSVAFAFAQTEAPADAHGKAAKPTTQEPSKALDPKLKEVLESLDKKMIKIDGGSFTMGCIDAQDTNCYYWEKPRHTVTISTFHMGKYPVTQKEWKAVMGTTPGAKDCAECPIEGVSWFDAQMFINKLNQLTGKNYRLPTEAEWEYAAKGGNQGRGFKYPGSNDANEVAWYDANSNKVSHPVGQKKANELGLYDLGGNVWQWCSDWFEPKYYSNSPSNNPQGPPTGNAGRCLRGGSWWGPVKDCRVANRDKYPAESKDDDVGFRLVR